MRKGKIMIIYHESSKTFHLYNNDISYIMCVLPNGHLGNLYFGKRIHDREDFSHLLEMKQRPMTACVYEGNRKFSLEHLKLEYPVYGSSDYRYPAVEILQEKQEWYWNCFILFLHRGESSPEVPDLQTRVHHQYIC